MGIISELSQQPYPVDFERKTRIKVELAKRNMTITNLADSLNVSRPYISAIISGRKISAKTEAEIAEALRMPTEYLFPSRSPAELLAMRKKEQRGAA